MYPYKSGTSKVNKNHPQGNSQVCNVTMERLPRSADNWLQARGNGASVFVESLNSWGCALTFVCARACMHVCVQWDAARCAVVVVVMCVHARMCSAVYAGVGGCICVRREGWIGK